MTKKIKTTKLEQEVKDLEEKFKRALADYQNQTKRHQTRQADIIKFANESLLDKLLPVLDSLELAQGHLKHKGLQLVLDQFIKVLKSEAVVPIKSDGQDFDPEIMDCSSVVSGKKDKVITTLSKGYLYNDRILRPARVEVGSGITKK